MMTLHTESEMRMHALRALGHTRATADGRARLRFWDGAIAVAATELVSDVLAAVEARGGHPLVVVAGPDGFIHWVDFVQRSPHEHHEPVDVASTIDMGMLIHLLRQHPGELLTIRECEPLGAQLTDGPHQLLPG